MTTECHPRGCRAARLLSLSILVIAAVFALPTSARAGALPLGATNQDVHLKGTQPGDLMDVIWPADICSFCHLGMDDPATTLKPWRWRGSLHSHATKDPIFQAGLAVARQDVGEATTFCYRCHSPAAWLEQRADPPTGELLTWEDFNHGVTCHVCHRLVNPVYVPGQSPADDELILGDLDSRGLLPTDTGSARYVVDPSDLRRGPFSDVNPPHPWAYSPFHTTGTLCGTCHDVSNPVFTRIGGATPAPNDTYELGAVNTPHPTGHDKDMYPEQRTYSEWLNSQFAATGVDMGGRFGGNNQVVRTCQDCHMEAVTGYGCDEKFFNPPLRQNLPYHGFTGANVTALDLLLHMYTPADFDNPGPNDFDQNTVTLVQRARGDTVSMLARATDLDLSVAGCSLRARITNQCGHKLLTGYPEGRRIWINVQFFDENNELIGQHGAYDSKTAMLTTTDTKVYETKHGLDPAMAATTGLPAGASLHLTLVNKPYKDNRIPPRGFTNAAFEAIQSGHFGYHYADGQYWDDTLFAVPQGATRADVVVYYQTMSRDYAEFLRDTNTAPAPNAGTQLWDAYVATGMGAPQVMDEYSFKIASSTAGLPDIANVIQNWGRSVPLGTDGDYSHNGSVGLDDIAKIIQGWATVRP